MRHRPVRWAVRLYPRGWRRRYGEEVADLAAELVTAKETTRLRAATDLVAFAARERANALCRSPRCLAAFGAMTAVAACPLAVVASLGPAGPGPTGPAVAVPANRPGGPSRQESLPAFVPYVADVGKLTGYIPAADLVAGTEAPVYAKDHRTVLGHEYPGIGFVPLGSSPWSMPCTPLSVVERQASGATVTSAVPCQSQTLVLPDVAGMATPSAAGELSGLGLGVDVVNVRSAAVAPGHIVATTPSGGSTVHARQVVVVENSV